MLEGFFFQAVARLLLAAFFSWLASLHSFLVAAFHWHWSRNGWSMAWQIWKKLTTSSIVILWYSIFCWTNMFWCSAEKELKKIKWHSFLQIVNSKSTLRSLYNLKRTLKQALKALGHIVQLFKSPLKVATKDIPCGVSMFTRKESILIFPHDDGKQPIALDIGFISIFVFHTSFSPVLWHEDALA